MSDKLKGIHEASEVRLQRQLLRHQKNLNALDDLDKEVDLVDDLRVLAYTDVSEISARQKLGSDVMWQGWLLHRRGELQRQKSLMKAREVESFESTRAEFKRSQAVSILLEEKSRQRRDTLKQKNQLFLEELSFLKSAAADGG